MDLRANPFFVYNTEKKVYLFFTKRKIDDDFFLLNLFQTWMSKRKDVVQRLKNKKYIEERVVGCSLQKRLGNGLDDRCVLLLKQEISDWVLSTSKITHRLSIIFNRFLLYLMTHKKPLPVFNDALFNGLALYGLKKSNKHSKSSFASLIEDFCCNTFSPDQYPKIQRQRGDCQAILMSAQRYKTNFLNSMFVPFYNRQKSFITVWLNVNGFTLDGSQKHNIQRKINGWNKENKKEDSLPSKIKDFIKEQRMLLKEPKTINDEWLKNNTSIVLSYYFYIIKYYTDNERGKKFRLAPLCRIKSHFLTVDNTVLRELIWNVVQKVEQEGLSIPEWLKEKVKKKEMTLEVWKAIFNYEGLRRRMTFSNRIETDGTKICFHFQVSGKRRKKKGRRKTSNKQQNKNKKKRIISIDPGRVNLITAYDAENGKYYKLTRKYNYRACGMKAVVKKNNERNLRLKEIYESMSQHPTKSIKDSDWYHYQKVIISHYDTLWEHHATEEVRREDFRVKRLKEKCLDRFLNQFRVKGESDPLLIYGAAKINPTGKGELSVPVKYMYNKCTYRYQTIKYDERNTTLMHRKCKEKTLAVKKGQRNIGGLRWCSTCRELVSRDRNACENINHGWNVENKEGKERPRYLSETFKREKVKFFLLGVKSVTPTITRVGMKPDS